MKKLRRSQYSLAYAEQTYSHMEKLPPDLIRITYLGTAGFVIEGIDRTVVLDPFITRPKLLRSMFGILVPNKDLIKKTIPYANDVLIGHTHYDHVLDAPDLCHQTGARLIGSNAAMMVGRAAGLPENQLLATKGNENIKSGAWTVRAIPSLHAKIMGYIPMAGDIISPPPWPPRIFDLKHGAVFDWLVDTGGLKFIHIDSADFIKNELHGMHADVVCLCALGRQNHPDYVKEIVNLIKPRWIIPCHWDSMTTPLHEPPKLIPGVDINGFIREIQAAGCEPILLPIMGQYYFEQRNPHHLLHLGRSI